MFFNSYVSRSVYIQCQSQFWSQNTFKESFMKKVYVIKWILADILLLDVLKSQRLIVASKIQCRSSYRLHECSDTVCSVLKTKFWFHCSMCQCAIISLCKLRIYFLTVVAKDELLHLWFTWWMKLFSRDFDCEACFLSFRCCTFTFKPINDPFSEIRGSLGGDGEWNKSEVRKRGQEVVTFHLSSRAPSCARQAGMVRPVTSLPCGEKNLLALPRISSKSTKQTLRQPASQSLRQPACYRPATYYLTPWLLCLTCF